MNHKICDGCETGFVTAVSTDEQNRYHEEACFLARLCLGRQTQPTDPNTISNSVGVNSNAAVVAEAVSKIVGFYQQDTETFPKQAVCDRRGPSRFRRCGAKVIPDLSG